MAELGKGYVQIIPTAEGISKKIGDILEPGAKSAGESGGASLVTSLKNTLIKLGVGATIGKFVKDSLEAGGALQQSFGGLETLYGDASDKAKEFAQAAAEAGISANDYAEQAVSFGAGLKAAFKGDTTKAIEAANTAIMDMADNSAKMGTDITAVQSAYQGFAKQNYTMLDNLKLGYGGTKTEMERLLADATKLSGIKYDINNLGDVYSAIHVIQEDLGLTGVAAKEASETFSGSLGAVKASFTNLLASMSLGQDITKPMEQLFTSASNFLLKNLIPMVGNIIKAVPSALASALRTIGPQIGTVVTTVFNNLPGLPTAGTAMINNLVNGVIAGLPGFISHLSALIGSALATAMSDMTSILTAGTTIVQNLFTSISNNFPMIISSVQMLLNVFAGTIRNNLPDLLNAGVEMVNEIVNGLLQGLPTFVSSAITLVGNFVISIIGNLPAVLSAGADILINLVNGIVQNFPTLVSSAFSAIIEFIAGIAQKLPDILQSGIEILGELAAGIIKAIPDLVAKLPEVFTAIKEKFTSYDWLQIGKDILAGIGNGIKNAVSDLVGAAGDALGGLVGGIKDKFKIGSPSKLMAEEIGRWIPAGIAVGIKENLGVLSSAMSDVESSIRTSGSASIMTSGNYRPGESYSVAEDLSRVIAGSGAQNVNVTVVLEGDAAKMFKVVKKEDKKFKDRTGSSRFVYG